MAGWTRPDARGTAFPRRTFLLGMAAAASSGVAQAASGAIEIGVCTRDLDSAARYGFDYIEPPAAELAEMSEEQFAQRRTQVLHSPLRCRSFNSLMRREDLKVVGENVALPEMQRYLSLVLPRCRELGARVVVWGSAGARNVPAGFPRERAVEQIASFLTLAGDIARKSELMFAIEPLRHEESNILTTGAETMELVRRVRHPNVRMIIDYYHMRSENEDPDIVLEARREIVHFHFATPQGRRWPHEVSEDEHYGKFFENIKKIGFRGGMSIEGRGTFEADARASLQFFRHELG